MDKPSTKQSFERGGVLLLKNSVIELSVLHFRLPLSFEPG